MRQLTKSVVPGHGVHFFDLLVTTSGQNPDSGLPNGLALRPVFQPIVAVVDGSVLALESLVRGPAGSPWESADALFRTAGEAGRNHLELRALEAVLDAARDARNFSGRFTLNIGPSLLLERPSWAVDLVHSLESRGLDPHRFVLELTEHEPVRDAALLLRRCAPLREAGMELAIDDLGSGFASMRLLVEVRPEWLKVDSWFVRGCHRSAVKRAFLRSLSGLARALGACAIAEGIEDPGEREVCIEMGFDGLQGWSVALPHPDPARFEGFTMEVTAPAVQPPVSCGSVGNVGEVLRLDSRSTNLGIANSGARVLHEEWPLERAALALARGPGSLDESVPVVRGGLRVGTVYPRDLLALLATRQAEPQRLLHPLSGLPGSTALRERMLRAMAAGRDFTTAWLDLEGLRGFNVSFGFEAGDEMLLRLGDLLAVRCGLPDHPLTETDLRAPLPAHLGGDDFAVVWPTETPDAPFAALPRLFAERTADLYPPKAIETGTFRWKDRKGRENAQRLVRLIVAVVPCPAGRFRHPEEVAEIGRDSLIEARRRPEGILIDRRLTSS